jgi:hypothetical protein
MDVKYEYIANVGSSIFLMVRVGMYYVLLSYFINSELVQICTVYSGLVNIFSACKHNS